jgi:hypothetical protein
MSAHIVLTREQVEEIFKAVNGISGILKSLPSQPENAAALHGLAYGIMSNLAVIQTTLARIPRTPSN